MNDYLQSTRATMQRRLLDAAAEILAEEGARGLTMRKVAARAGCSTSVLYSRFGSKEGLIESLWIEGFARLWDAEQAARSEQNPLQRLRDLGLAYWRTAVEHPHYYQAMFGGALPGFQPSSQAVEESRRTFAVLVDAVGTCMDAGILHRDDPEKVATLLWSTLHGLAHLYLQNLLPVDAAEALLEWAMPRLITGLAPGESKSPNRSDGTP